jgi:hypothetical protein
MSWENRYIGGKILKKTFVVASLLLLLGLVACSNEEAGGKQTGQEVSSKETKEDLPTEKAKTEEKDRLTAKDMEILAQEYNLDEFRFLPKEEQENYIIPLVKGLGYNENLALWILEQIINPDTQIPSSIMTVSDYAKFYVDVVDIQDGYKLEWKKEEEKALADKGIEDVEIQTESETIKIAAANVDKRLKAIEGKPLLEMNENGHYTLLGIRVGDSGGQVYDSLGEPDKIGKIEDGVNYHYYIPASNAQDGLEYYRLILPIVGGSIQEITLMINNKDGYESEFEIPKPFIDRFQGEIYASGLTDQLFSSWNDAYVHFISTSSGLTDSLKVEPEGNDFTLRAEVLDDFGLENLKQVNNELITLDEAMEIINDPESFYEKSEKYF